MTSHLFLILLCSLFRVKVKHQVFISFDQSYLIYLCRLRSLVFCFILACYFELVLISAWCHSYHYCRFLHMLFMFDSFPKCSTCLLIHFQNISFFVLFFFCLMSTVCVCLFFQNQFTTSHRRVIP